MKCLYAPCVTLCMVITTPALACTTILVGGQSTVDGSTIIARNDDSSSAFNPCVMLKHKARAQPYKFVSNPAHGVTNGTFTIEMPAHTLPYLAYPRLNTLTTANPSFEETGINSYNVAVSATESFKNSQQVLNADNYTPAGITEDGITSVIQAQATSARHGISLLGQIIETHGAGEGFGVAISDRYEVWYLETASGHHWVAQRLPEAAYFVSANHGWFQDIDLSDTMNVAASTGFVSFLQKHHLYNPSEGPVNLFKCCMASSPADEDYNYSRIKRLVKKFSNIDITDDSGLFTVFWQPSKQLSVWDVASGLRDHYNNTGHDPYTYSNPKEPWRPISVIRTSISHITQNYPDLPRDIATIEYISLGMTALGAYLPIPAGITSVPIQLSYCSSTVDGRSLFWKKRKLEALVFTDYKKYAPDVVTQMRQFEQDTDKKLQALKENYIATYQHSLPYAQAMIQTFVEKMLVQYDAILSAMVSDLMHKTGNTGMTNSEFASLINKTEQEYHFEGL